MLTRRHRRRARTSAPRALRTVRALRRWLRRDDGAAMAETGLLIAAIALVAVGGAKCLGGAINTRLSQTGATVANP